MISNISLKIIKYNKKKSYYYTNNTIIKEVLIKLSDEEINKIFNLILLVNIFDIICIYNKIGSIITTKKDLLVNLKIVTVEKIKNDFNKSILYIKYFTIITYIKCLNMLDNSDTKIQKIN